MKNSTFDWVDSFKNAYSIPLLRYHRLVGFLDSKDLKKLPPHFSEAFKLMKKSIIAKNKLYKSEYTKIINSFKNNNIVFAPVKGIVQIEQGYLDREMDDIDIMVDKNHLKTSFNLLTDLGYKKITKTHREKYYEEYIFVNEKLSVVVELSTVFSRFLKFKAKDLIPFDVNKEFIITAYHATYLHPFLRFSWYVDCYRLAKHIDFDFNKVKKLSNQLNISNTIDLTYEILNTYFNTDFKVQNKLLKKIYLLKRGYLFSRFANERDHFLFSVCVRLYLENSFKRKFFVLKEFFFNPLFFPKSAKKNVKTTIFKTFSLRNSYNIVKAILSNNK